VGVINLYDASAPDADGRPRVRELDLADALRRLGGRADAILFEPGSGVTGVAADPAARARLESLSVEWR
jgi:hypothetical protein